MRKMLTGLVVAAGLGASALAQAPAPAQKTWVDWITLKGDVRYRFETINDDSKKDADKDTYTRYRNRIRARLGLEAKCTEDLKAGLEFSTGQSDPVSGNQTLGDGFTKKDMKLNLAYMDYNFFGANPYELHGIAGKMKNPFIQQPDDLVWDSDLTPEGLAFKGQAGEGFATFFANGGSFWVKERDAESDTMLYAGQAAVKLTFVPEVSLSLGGSYYGYQNVEGYDVIDWESKNNSYGNSTTKGSVSGNTTNKAWAEEFTPMVGFAQLDLWVLNKPLSFFGQAVNNPGADEDNRGFMAGVSLGKAKNPQSWEVGYSFAKLEKDATLGMFTDSDRWGGGTDGQGHKIYCKYQIMKNLQAGITGFLDKKKISDSKNESDYGRFQVDLTAAF